MVWGICGAALGFALVWVLRWFRWCGDLLPMPGGYYPGHWPLAFGHWLFFMDCESGSGAFLDAQDVSVGFWRCCLFVVGWCGLGAVSGGP